MDVIFWIAVGIVIGAFAGWHYPEPDWAKSIKEKVLTFIRSRLDNKK